MTEPRPALFDAADPAPAPPGLTPADLDVPDPAWRRAARSRRTP